MIKSARLEIKCYPHEREALATMAAHEGRNMSEMLRELIRESAIKRGAWPLPTTGGRERYRDTAAA